MKRFAHTIIGRSRIERHAQQIRIGQDCGRSPLVSAQFLQKIFIGAELRKPAQIAFRRRGTTGYDERARWRMTAGAQFMGTPQCDEPAYTVAVQGVILRQGRSQILRQEGDEIVETMLVRLQSALTATRPLDGNDIEPGRTVSPPSQ